MLYLFGQKLNTAERYVCYYQIPLEKQPDTTIKPYCYHANETPYRLCVYCYYAGTATGTNVKEYLANSSQESP